ncbi:MAG: hypothetical protein ACTSUS_08070 [Candidatus Freyarchaeota archaeon]
MTGIQTPIREVRSISRFGSSQQIIDKDNEAWRVFLALALKREAEGVFHHAYPRLRC